MWTATIIGYSDVNVNIVLPNSLLVMNEACQYHGSEPRLLGA
jgi:hypothetical protein